MAHHSKWHSSDKMGIETPEESFIDFPTNYTAVLERIDAIDPVRYARTRNFLDGAVTYLSPYISRGVISTRQVFELVKAKGYSFSQMEKLVSELAWRDFFQRVWQAKGELLFTDIRQQQPDYRHREMIKGIEEANTGIDTIDQHIEKLLQTGYMHNHLRMYTASITCNMGKAHWLTPSRWMYHHLLDGDLASNSLSWQWVAAAFSGKKYYANQENINKYTGSNQTRSYLNNSYELIADMEIPLQLAATSTLQLKTTLPATPSPTINPALPILLYNSYQLDPHWRSGEPANRILLLEPSHFTKYPVSEKVLSFVIKLAQENIEGIQVVTGEIEDIPLLSNVPGIYAKEHPAFGHYPGIKDERSWLVPEVSGYFSGFFNYWKKIEKQLRVQFK